MTRLRPSFPRGIPCSSLKSKLIISLALIALAAADLLAGAGGFSVADGAVLWQLRVPRVLAAVIAGAALSLSGMQMQAIFRNPLADPHIMGVSSGAGLGAALAALVMGGAGSAAGGSLALWAFAGASATGGLMIFVSGKVRGGNTLLLFGVMAGFILSAVSSIVQYSSSEEGLKIFYNWMAGSFAAIGYGEIAVMGGALVAGVFLALAGAKGMDIILFGDEYSSLRGADPSRIRAVAMLGCCLMTGAVTAFAGPLGFVGIAGPHIARALSGSSVHRRILPEVLMSGAAMTLAADILANVWATPLPVGSTLAVLGIPVILVILTKGK